MLVEEFMTWCERVRGMRTGTLTAYRGVVQPYVETMGDHRILAGDVTAHEVEQFLQRERHPGGGTHTITPAAATMARDRVVLGTFYKWLGARKGVAGPMFDVARPKVSNTKPTPVSDEVWLRVWGQDMERADRAWVGLGYFAGLRRSEIAAVSPDQFDRARGQVRIWGKGNKERVVEYGTIVQLLSGRLSWLGAERWLPDLDWLIEERSGERVLIPWDLPATEATRYRSSMRAEWMPDSKVLWRRLRRLCASVSVPSDECGPHMLRASAATNLFRCGVPEFLVAELLGHASLDTTRRYVATAGQLENWLRNGAH